MTEIGKALAAGRADVDAGVPSYSPLADPKATEVLGRALADTLADAKPTVVCYWDYPDLVLAHVVARELGASIVHGLDAQGVVDVEGEIPAGARVAIVASAIRITYHLLSMTALVNNHDAEVVGVAVCVGTPALAQAAGDQPVHVLVEQA